jgi:hypothetical protein
MVKIDLDYPFDFNGMTVGSVSLRRGTAADVWKSRALFDDAPRQELATIALLAGKFPEAEKSKQKRKEAVLAFFAEMDAADLMEVRARFVELATWSGGGDESRDFGPSFLLDWPYTTGSGEALETFTLKRCKTLWLLEAQTDFPDDSEDPLMARLAGLVKEDLAGMDLADYEEAKRRFQGLFRRSAQPGQPEQGTGAAG